MTKNLKILVAGAMVLGASAAMAECGESSTLGLTGIENECCVYNYNEEIITGYLLDYNNAIGDESTTIKCQFKPEKTKDKKENRPANKIYSTDEDHTGEECNTLNANENAVVTGVWTNIVSSAGITSLVCEYSPPTQSTGIAYYIDSAVSGINYTCGSTSGITGADGSFIFEVGSSCTFYLGDIELRSVDESLLEDGNTVYETDVEIARILQSLDIDGDPSTGITIDAGIVTAMVDAGITALPDTTEEMDAILVAAGVTTVVNEEDAAAHILTTLLVGQTYYGTACDPDSHVDTLVFGEDGTLAVTGMESMTYEIDGAVLSIVTPDGTMTFTNVEQGVDYILFPESEGGKFYTSESAASDALVSSCGAGSVPANDLISGQVTFDGHADDPVISTEGAWIRITPTVFATPEGHHNSLQCEIAPDGSFGNSNCVIHYDEAGVRAAFDDPNMTFSYGIFRDSNTNTYWDCDEDYFGGSGMIDVTLSELQDITVFANNFGSRTCP